MPEDLDPSDDTPPDNSVIRGLREKAERADTAEAERDQLQRELVVHKAGLTDLSDKQLKALSAAHEGDWEPEGLKATATELGFGPKASAEEPAPKASPEELASMQRMAAASGGTPPPPTDLDTAIAQAQSPAELKAVLAAADMLVE